jgi:hypothetical protein
MEAQTPSVASPETAEMLSAHNRPDNNCELRNMIQVISFRILDGYPDNEGIEMRVSLKGTSILSVDWN